MSQTHSKLSDVRAMGVPVLDAVTVRSGSMLPLSQFFLLSVAAAKRIGVEIRYHDDLSTLVQTNQTNRNSWNTIGPMFDPAASALPPRTAYWLSAHDTYGDVVATSAARLLTLGRGGLTAEFESLRLYYADPAPHLAQGTTCVVERPARDVMDDMHGWLTYSGAQWTRPDYRGRGIVHLMSRINRSIGMTHWGTYYTASVTIVDLAEKQALTPYGYRSARRIVFKRSYRGDFDCSLIWVDRKMWEDDIAVQVNRLQTEKIARVTDADDTNSPDFDVQGSKSLS